MQCEVRECTRLFGTGEAAPFKPAQTEARSNNCRTAARQETADETFAAGTRPLPAPCDCGAIEK